MKNPSIQSLEASLSEKSRTLSQISKKILSAKQLLWESEARKQYLQQKLAESKSPWDSEVFFSELRAKYEQCKGSCIEKLLLSLIKSLEVYKKTSLSLSSITSMKEDLLNNYKEITGSLAQESNLRVRITEMQEKLQSKEKMTESLKLNLETLRNQLNHLRASLDNGQVKELIHERQLRERELNKCLEDNGILQIEIDKTCQLIETEKNVSNVSPEAANRLIKTKIKEVENLLAETVTKIRSKEKQKEKTKQGISKILTSFPSSPVKSMTSPNKSEIFVNKSLYSERQLQSKPFTPKNQPVSMKSSASTPAFKFSDRSKLAELLAKPSEKSKARAQQILKQFGSESQSFASKIVQINRGSYFN